MTCQLDFTIRDPTKEFTIHYVSSESRLTYHGYDSKTGCFNLTLVYSPADRYLVVSDQSGNVVFKNPFSDGEGKVCTKFIQLSSISHGSQWD